MQIQPSRISAVRVGEVRTPRTETPPNQDPVRETDARRLRDRADIGGGPPGPDSPAERLDKFAATVDDRLQNLAAESGQDLSEVQAQFAGYVERLQNGIADGTLSGEDLARGVRETLSMTSGSVRDALGLDQADDDMSSDRAGGAGDLGDVGQRNPALTPEERIDRFEQRINERLGAIAQDADPETIAALREAQQLFAEGLEGLREGLGDGTFDGSNIGGAVQRALASLGSDVREALAQPSDDNLVAEQDDVSDVEAESTISDRLEAFGDRLAERLGNLSLGDREGAVVREAGSDFLSLLERLSDASSSGSLSGDQAASLFQRALADFSSDLSGLIGNADDGLDLYGPDAQRRPGQA